MTFKKTFFFIIMVIVLKGGLFAQAEFPNTDFWALDAGIGSSNTVDHGVSFDILIEPKLSITHSIMAGGRFAANFSNEEDSRNILAFESQVFLRWNFLRFGNPNNTTNIYVQGGLGLLAAYRGDSSNMFNNPTMTRGSLLADAAFGVTIPLTQRFHIEPQIRSGYPHMFGVSLTAGYRFPIRHRTEYIETIRTLVERETVTRFVELPPEEIVKMISIASVEYIIFGPDITRYNVGIDSDARALNDLILNHTVSVLRDNPTFRVRIEGHANPIDLSTPPDIRELERVSRERTEEIARLLIQRGVREEQIVNVYFGGTRVVASDHEHRNMNRRVEIIIVEINTDLFRELQ